jgi:hypothetical protein
MLLICAFQVSAGEASKTEELERGYATAAKQLRICLINSFQDAATVAHIHAALIEAKLDIGAPGLRLRSISLTPPTLRQDPNDLYKRYASAVVFEVDQLDRNGQAVKAQPIEVSLPVYANPELRWSFPDCDQALRSLSKKFTDMAIAILTVRAETEALKASTRDRKTKP